MNYNLHMNGKVHIKVINNSAYVQVINDYAYVTSYKCIMTEFDIRIWQWILMTYNAKYFMIPVASTKPIILIILLLNVTK